MLSRDSLRENVAGMGVVGSGGIVSSLPEMMFVLLLLFLLLLLLQWLLLLLLIVDC